MGSDGKPSYQARNPEQLDQLRLAARSAVGFNERRGDTLELINMPFATISDEAADRLAGYSAFIVYGTDYADPIAASASKRLMEMGYKRVFTLRGGLRAWKRDGQPIVSGSTPDGAKK